MLSRNEIKDYAIRICIPLMERNLRRTVRGDWAYKPDQVGFLPAYLENFCRPFWGIAPILASKEELTLTVFGETMSVFTYMRSVLCEGFGKEKKHSWHTNHEYFGAYTYENQNITELAGLMIGIFFARDVLWEPLSQEEKDLFAREIYEMAEAAFDHSWPNNHYWFPLFAFTVLKRLGYYFERIDSMMESGLRFLDGLYIGDGWYKDGEFGRFDYYEAWSLHLYPLLWTLIADESFAGYDSYRCKYIERTNAFLDFYIHWFDENGAHVPFGRSLTYRFAASALFPVAVLAGCDVDPVLAGRITAKNMEFFLEHVQAEETQILPEGYLYHAPALVEGYTSDGGAYWCCKTFLALLIEEGHPFWDYDKCEGIQLPAEKGNYLVGAKHKDIHMLFEANDGIVTMYNNTAQYYTNGRVTHDFGNLQAWYSKFVYNSAAGFGCSAMDKVSLDNMISLVTEDGSMCSHRYGFRDLGYENGMLKSVHIPFANDPATTIESFVIPCGSFHVRAHKVHLAHPYVVREGGFALGRWDDYLPLQVGGNCVSVENRHYISAMKTVSDTDIRMDTGSVQANHHLYAPLANYPMYTTKKVLNPGDYVFASAFAVRKLAEGTVELPEMRLTMEKKTSVLEIGRAESKKRYRF